MSITLATVESVGNRNRNNILHRNAILLRKLVVTEFSVSISAFVCYYYYYYYYYTMPEQT